MVCIPRYFRLWKAKSGKLGLNDAAFTFQSETSVALGLVLDVISSTSYGNHLERLRREYDLDLISTYPSVVYRVHFLRYYSCWQPVGSSGYHRDSKDRRTTDIGKDSRTKSLHWWLLVSEKREPVAIPRPLMKPEWCLHTSTLNEILGFQWSTEKRYSRIWINGLWHGWICWASLVRMEH